MFVATRMEISSCTKLPYKGPFDLSGFVYGDLVTVSHGCE